MRLARASFAAAIANSANARRASPNSRADGRTGDEEFLTYYLSDDCWNKPPAHEREED
jgi:hypothetical protein